MKNIHDILGGLGIEVPEDQRAGFEKELLENYKTAADCEKQVGKRPCAI